VKVSLATKKIQEFEISLQEVGHTVTRIPYVVLKIRNEAGEYSIVTIHKEPLKNCPTSFQKITFMGETWFT
jgi:hypothetical protein